MYNLTSFLEYWDKEVDLAESKFQVLPLIFVSLKALTNSLASNTAQQNQDQEFRIATFAN